MKYIAVIIAGLLLTGCVDDNEAKLIKQLTDECPGEVTILFRKSSSFGPDSVEVSCRTSYEQRKENGKRN